MAVIKVAGMDPQRGCKMAMTMVAEKGESSAAEKAVKMGIELANCMAGKLVERKVVSMVYLLVEMQVGVLGVHMVA